MADFKDYFSNQSDLYSRYRPVYPEELFKYLAEISEFKTYAWDCATGNGQAALGLSPYFENIIATDASAKQLHHAVQHPKISYKNVPAEKTEIDAESIDLVTVAQAIHWFNFDAFYEEVKRVLKSAGHIAVWTYNLPAISAEIDPLLHDFYGKTIHDYWPPERILVEDNYRNIPFPFKRVAAPTFQMRTQWTRDDILGFLYTWSAVNKYMEAEKKDPVKNFKSRLYEICQDPAEKFSIEWPLTLLVGQK